MKHFVTFILGAAVGSLVTWKIAKTKYEQIAQKEIDSVKEGYSKKMEEVSEFKKTCDAYENYAKRYSDKDDPIENVDEEIETESDLKNEDKADRPYVIPPDEFGGIDEYERISLTHYSDGILTDDCDDPIENVDEVVGADYADHFGEYDDGTVYIRNDKFKCDYEILLDLRKYSRD